MTGRGFWVIVGMSFTTQERIISAQVGGGLMSGISCKKRGGCTLLLCLALSSYGIQTFYSAAAAALPPIPTSASLPSVHPPDRACSAQLSAKKASQPLAFESNDGQANPS